ncbi:MAG: transcriptional regulator of arginine metabolism [Clostridia bacterium]|nr:transcriptional regulator of arginine metabolism [Clostridia bacterium]
MKVQRRRAILDIIASRPVETQAALAQELRRLGFRVTQATVSRDIKEMGLVKIKFGENRYRYAQPEEQRLSDPLERLQRLFRDAVVKMDSSENLIVIHTLPGTAHAVAACLDKLNWPEIIGTVAGDDTILVVAKPREAVPSLLARFQDLVE